MSWPASIWPHLSGTHGVPTEYCTWVKLEDELICRQMATSVRYSWCTYWILYLGKVGGWADMPPNGHICETLLVYLYCKLYLGKVGGWADLPPNGNVCETLLKRRLLLFLLLKDIKQTNWWWPCIKALHIAFIYSNFLMEQNVVFKSTCFCVA